MPERVTPADPGLLSSLADQLSLPGYAVRNLLLGEGESAARNVGDFALNTLDALIPGDVIPELSQQRDRPEFRDVVEMPDNFAGSVGNFLGNVVTDPITYVPGAAVAKGFGAVGKGVSKVTPQAVKDVASKAGKVIRKTAGAERIGKPLANVLTKAQGARETAARASQEPIVEGLKGASQRELEAAGEVLLNVTKDKASGALRAIDESDTLSVQDRLARYVLDNPDVDPAKLAQIVSTSQNVSKGQWASGQAGNIFTDIGRQPASDVVMGAVPGTTAREGVQEYFPRVFKNEDVTDIAERLGQPNAIKGRKLESTKDVLEYLAQNPQTSLVTNAAEVLGQRAAAQGELAARGATGQGLFDLARAGGAELPDELLAKALAQQRMAQPAKAVVTGGDDAAKSVDEMLGGRAPDQQSPAFSTGPERDPYYMGDVPRMRAINEDLGAVSQSGKSVVGKSTATTTGITAEEKQQAREWLLSQQYKQADPLLREAAEAIAKNLPGDEADVALHFLKGMKGRTGLPKALAALNRPFKPVAVYGAIVPKIGSVTRNMISGIAQKYANPEARGTISLKNIPAFFADWGKSIDDGVERLIGRRVFSKNEFAAIDEAFKQAGGDPRKALSLIKDPTMRDAVERGVFGNNFVDTEQLISQASKQGLKALPGRIWDWPAYMFKGAEQRMRYGLYKSLVKSGKSADDAARITRDSFFDYSISSAENRLARDVIPFAQFMFKAIPQQAKMLAEKPALASAAANLYAQGRDEPVSPFMEGKLNLPIGTDEQGNRQYIGGLGLPIEALSILPNPSANPLQFGRDIEQNIVGSSSPLLKLAYAYTSGRDPVFGSMPGSYSKVAGQDLGQAGSILNQLIGTGVAPAVAFQQLAGTAGKFADERTSLPETAVNLLTGARIQSVDPQRAIQQRLQAFLERSPDIGQFRSFYSQDPDAQELIQNLTSARKALKEKQKDLAPVN